MSRVTNPVTEQSVSCGFFNSDGIAGSRKYYASEMSAIFDGIIKDGVFASIGTALVVEAGSGNTVNVGIGKCWFNHTWTLNDAILPIDCGDSEVLLNRIDAIVVEVNDTDTVQDNFIKAIKGTPATNPSRPTLANEERVHQYALCYIYRKAGTTEITQSDITNMVGVETPFITGILETVKPEEFCKQWQDGLDRFMAAEKADVEAFMAAEKADVEAFMDSEKADVDAYMTARETEFNNWYSQMTTLMEDVVNETTTWTENQKASVLDWFETMKNQLSADSAINLQLQINRAEIEKMLLVGLIDGEKTFSEDGTVITSVDSKGRKLVKTFTNNFLTITIVLTDANDTVMGEMVKNLSSDGSVINTEVTIYEIETELEDLTYEVVIEDDTLILS